MSEQVLPVAHVVLATKSRPRESYELLNVLAAQTLKPASVIVVGSEPADVAGLDRHELRAEGRMRVLLAPAPGATIQRNVGLNALAGELDRRDAFIVFFDDDFRPAPDWLRTCAEIFQASPEVAGVTGHVLADGVGGPGISEVEARAYLSGETAPARHWSDVRQPRDVESLYGCNMAYRASICRSIRFDESLPLYAWQEDCDFSGQVRRMGRTIVDPACRGVHLGTKAGRTSGIKFGYSQIANPLHIAGRRNMSWKRATRFVARALAANIVRSARRHELFDYRGRLRGNLVALTDLMTGRCHPQRILSLH
ncbi:MAG TPA: glycosyltransferase [Caulobacteraceae bacterium]